MNQAFWTDRRIAGSLLVASLLILFLALIILIASGAAPAFPAIVQGRLAQVAPYAATFRLLILVFAVGWIVQLLGLALLTRLLVRAGGEQLAILAFTLILVATIMAILWSAFRMSVELWAAQEAARTGSVPELFEPLKAWTSSFFRVASRAHFLATAGFGLGILRTGLLARWVGWVAIGWSLLWLLGGLGGGVPPATPLIMPAVIGFALLRK
ncbi:MAG TPA: hypothetical protein VF177_20980 [Anaerolineae bacterium]